MDHLTTRMTDTLAWIATAGPLSVGRRFDPMRNLVGARTVGALEARGLVERSYTGPGAGKVSCTRRGHAAAAALRGDMSKS